MKVIQVIDSFETGGGVNSFVYDMCFALKEIGCDVSLVGIMDSGYDGNPLIDELRHQGVRVECLGAKSKKDAILFHIRGLRKIISSIADNNKTICNLHLKLSVLMGVLATIHLKNVKCVETYHNTYHHYHVQCWFCSPFIKKYITVSEKAKEEMHSRFRISSGRIIAIPNGVSRDTIRKKAAGKTQKPNDDVIRLVSVGRMSYEKNFSTPVSAYKTMCCEKVKYLLVGDGPQKSVICDLSKDNPYIAFLGSLPREEALQTLATADIVVLPSLWEGRSILQLEAMALDKPMVLSDVPGLREPFHESALGSNELFRVCKFGYLVHTKRTESYRAALNDFINNRKRDFSSYISEVSKENDISITAQKYMQQYNELFKPF